MIWYILIRRDTYAHTWSPISATPMHTFTFRLNINLFFMLLDNKHLWHLKYFELIYCLLFVVLICLTDAEENHFSHIIDSMLLVYEHVAFISIFVYSLLYFKQTVGLLILLQFFYFFEKFVDFMYYGNI